ncbi:hypothetical protein J6590_023346 [Homalodisca vitripennis]|nr:hypothetical protein J6590_023346 [Homalodisca vitripennis]
MPRHLISDAHEWINEIPSVPIYYLAKPLPRERALGWAEGVRRLLRHGGTVFARQAFKSCRRPVSRGACVGESRNRFLWVPAAARRRLRRAPTPTGKHSLARECADKPRHDRPSCERVEAAWSGSAALTRRAVGRTPRGLTTPKRGSVTDLRATTRAPLPGSGKPCLVIGSYKYRESHVLAIGDVAWRCLGSTCKVSVKTNTDRTSILVHKDVHTGRHPQTYRNVSPAHIQTRKTSTEPLSPVNSRDLPFSPLISQQINKIRCIERAIQTEEECLKSTDDLLDRIAELTQRQSSLIDKIQSLQLELEAEKIAVRSRSTPEVVNVAVGCEPEKKLDFTMQTDLFIPMCEQCPVLEQKICQAEDMIEKLHLSFSELHVKYNDLRESHEQLLYLQGTETRNDDSLVNRPLEIHPDVPVTNMFNVLGSKDDT